MTSATEWLGGATLVGALVTACKSAPAPCEGPSCTAGSGSTGTAGAPPASCPPNGVEYGPWALAFDEASAIVRWDGCGPGPTEIVLEPEGGGAAVTVAGVQRASDVQTSYEILDVPPDRAGVRYLSEVAVRGLAAGSCYRYQLAADASRAGRICTARPPGASFTVLAVGDTNPSIGDTAGVLAHTLAAAPDFVVHLGDIQYYASVVETWASWFPKMQPLLAAGAFMPCIGNHEYEQRSEFADYYERLFGNNGTGTVDHYRYASGGVWFFSLNTELAFGSGSPQGAWLEKELAAASASAGHRLSIVYFHRPMITLAGYAQNKSERLYYAPLFQQHRVRLVLQGHVHGYERFVENAITYVVSGGGGAALHDLEANKRERPDEASVRQAASKTYHALLLEVGDKELRARAVSHKGAELDAFSIPLD
jgi:hypothetical protein